MIPLHQAKPAKLAGIETVVQLMCERADVGADATTWLVRRARSRYASGECSPAASVAIAAQDIRAVLNGDGGAA